MNINDKNLEKIKQLQNEGKTIYYNNPGTPLAYKNGIKHISSANITRVDLNNNYKANEDIITYNFLYETLLLIKKNTIFKLKSLEFHE